MNSRTYHIYTSDFTEAAKLAALEEGALKQAFRMPEPQSHDLMLS